MACAAWNTAMSHTVPWFRWGLSTYTTGNLGLPILQVQMVDLAVVMLCSQGFLNAMSLVIFKLQRRREGNSNL